MTADQPTLHEWLSRISRQLDILTMVLLDIKRDMVSLPAFPAIDPDADYPESFTPPEKPPTLGEAQVMPDGETTYIRQPLPGKHFLMLTVDTESHAIQSMRIELPNGDQVSITAEELKQTFGIDIPIVNADPASGPHPTDASLNPDVEVSDES